jgi:hypothetical protein
MNPGIDLAKVVALTATPSFIDIYDNDKAYKPVSVGEFGFMKLTDAKAAQTAGDVMIMTEHTPQEIEAAIKGPPVGYKPDSQSDTVRAFAAKSSQQALGGSGAHGAGSQQPPAPAAEPPAADPQAAGDKHA